MTTRAEFAVTHVLAHVQAIILKDGSRIRRGTDDNWHHFNDVGEIKRSAETLTELLIDISSEAWFGVS